MKTTLRYSVLERVRHGEGNTRAVAHRLRASMDRVSAALRKLTADGFIRRVSAGEYAYVRGTLRADGRGGQNQYNGTRKDHRGVDLERYDRIELEKAWANVVLAQQKLLTFAEQ